MNCCSLRVSVFSSTREGGMWWHTSVHICNPSTQEAGAGGSAWIQGHSGIRSKIDLKDKTTRHSKWTTWPYTFNYSSSVYRSQDQVQLTLWLPPFILGLTHCPLPFPILTGMKGRLCVRAEIPSPYETAYKKFQLMTGWVSVFRTPALYRPKSKGRAVPQSQQLTLTKWGMQALRKAESYVTKMIFKKFNLK